jgi:hypothetical protein
MKKEFKPRSFDDFAAWIKSEVGQITIEDLMIIYKKITEKKKATPTSTSTNSEKK